MAFLDRKSNAPTPSTDKRVADSSRSVNDCSAWDTHSHPARVLSACWNGAVADSTFSGELLGSKYVRPSAERRRQPRCPSYLQMVCAELSSVPTAEPRVSTLGPEPWRRNLQFGTKNQTPDLIPTKGTDVLKSCPTAQGRHLVVRFKCSSQKDCHPTGQPQQVLQNLHRDRVPWPWWATDWVGQLCQRVQRVWGHHGPFKGAPCGGQLAQRCQLFCMHHFGFVAGRSSSSLPDRCLFCNFGQVSAFCQQRRPPSTCLPICLWGQYLSRWSEEQ